MAIEDELPPETNLNGDWSSVVSDLYDIFCSTFINNPVRFNGRPILHDRRKLEDSLEEGFWHVVSSDQYIDGKKERVPDYDRARRLCWIRVMLESHPCEGLCCFRYLEGSGKHNVYIWIKALGYVIILKELSAAYFLLTAFAVTRERTRRDLEKKCQKGSPI